MKRPQVIETVSDLRNVVREWRRQGLSVAMVPTMGALHDGHVSLTRIALERADRCVVSIFVNPTQFAPTEDLDKYPRQLAADLDRLAEAGVQLAFTPTAAEMYPEGFGAKVIIGAFGGTGNRFPPDLLRRRGNGSRQALPPNHARLRDLRREGLPAAVRGEEALP